MILTFPAALPGLSSEIRVGGRQHEVNGHTDERALGKLGERQLDPVVPVDPRGVGGRKHTLIINL